MNDELHGLSLVLAGRPVEDPWDRLCRYCGLDWSGGPSETWAYRYFDAVDTPTENLTPIDVLAAAALHPSLSRQDLGYFWDRRSELEGWLEMLPHDTALRDADDTMIDRLSELSGWEMAPPLSLLSKVLHRKRPALIPLVDREILDAYRPIVGERSATAAWPGLLRALRDDLGGQNALNLAIMNTELEKRLGRRVTHLRLIDVVLWMGSQR